MCVQGVMVRQGLGSVCAGMVVDALVGRGCVQVSKGIGDEGVYVTYR